MNVPNFLSLLRILLSIPLFILLWQDLPIPAFLVFAVALGTDFLDGWSARRLNAHTELGRVLDPVADKVLVGVVVVALAARGKASVELAAVVILRDLLLLVFSWTRYRRGASVPSASGGGKVAFGLLGVYLAGIVFGVAWPAWVPAVVGGAYAVTGVLYARRLPRLRVPRVLKGDR